MLRSLLTAVAICVLVAPAQAETYRVVTAETLSPFSRGADKALPGVNHELVAAMAARSGVDLEIEYVPWKRAQAIAKDEPNTLVFGLARNATREPHYAWLVQLRKTEGGFFTTGTRIDTYAEAEGLASIGSRSIYARELLGMGWTNVDESESDVANLRQLQAGRVDAVFGLIERGIFEWKELGFDPATLVIGEPLMFADQWLAGHKDFPADVGEKLKAALVELQADGTYDALNRKYFGDRQRD